MIYAKTLKEILEKKLKENKIEYSSLTVSDPLPSGHHPEITITLQPKAVPGKYLQSIRFKISGLPSGCGLVMLSGFTGAFSNIPIFKILLKETLKIYAKDGAGTVICTLGDSYKCRFDDLKSLDFEILNTYPNLKHGKGYNQTLFISHVINIKHLVADDDVEDDDDDDDF